MTTAIWFIHCRIFHKSGHGLIEHMKFEKPLRCGFPIPSKRQYALEVVNGRSIFLDAIFLSPFPSAAYYYEHYCRIITWVHSLWTLCWWVFRFVLLWGQRKSYDILISLKSILARTWWHKEILLWDLLSDDSMTTIGLPTFCNAIHNKVYHTWGIINRRILRHFRKIHHSLVQSRIKA